MKTWIKVLSIGLMALMLGACGKKSNKSNTVATTPTTPIINTGSCLNYTYIPATGQYFDPATGQYVTNCQGYGNTGALPGNPLVPNQQGQWGYQQGCDSYYYTYGIQYFPMNIGGQLVCVRQDLMGQYMGGYQQQVYWQQPNYYMCSWNDPWCNSGYNGGGNGYNNHYYGGGYGAGGCLNFGGSTFQQTYGISGQLGICW